MIINDSTLKINNDIKIVASGHDYARFVEILCGDYPAQHQIEKEEALKIIRFLKEEFNFSDGIDVAGYTLSTMRNGTYWIFCNDGEGMECDKNKFEKLIDDFYAKEF